MKRYCSLLRFTDQGARNLQQSPVRADAFRQAVEQAGVKIEAQFWTLGAYDGVLILSGEDEHAILRCLAELAAKGNVRTETLRAMDAEELAAIVGSTQ